MSGLTLERLLFDPSSFVDGPKLGSYIISAAGDVIAATDVAGVKGLNVNMLGDVHIRDLAYASDSVTAHQGGTWTIDTITNVVHIDDNSGSITVDATNLDIRDLAYASDSVTAHQGGTWTIDAITNVVHIDDNSGSITVDATNLDIRDLAYASDSVTAYLAAGSEIKITDGTDSLAINNDGSINIGNVISVNDAPNAANASVARAMTDVAAAIPASPLAARRRMLIQNFGGENVFVGPSGVTAASGLEINKGATLALEIGPSNLLYGICATGKSSSLRVLELS
jgi:hypothetical protein